MSRVAVDVMGSDAGVGPIIDGALAAAAAHPNLHVILVGHEREIHEHLEETSPPDRVSVEHASDVIHMDEEPLAALRQKRGSSVAVAARLVRDGKADAMVSPGNTGAAMAAGTMLIGRLKGVDRPAIAAMLPSLEGNVLLLDAGANVNCRPSNLLQFGQMGSVYAEKLMDRPKPSVGLLSVGEEETKGDRITKAAHNLLRDSSLHFVGNVEGRDIAYGLADVIVCDGFVGNVVLKAAEGFAEFFVRSLKAELTSTWHAKLGALILRPGLKRFAKRLDYAEYGGAPLLGINGVCIIAHGSSNSRAVANAVRCAALAVESKLVETLRESMVSEALQPPAESPVAAVVES